MISLFIDTSMVNVSISIVKGNKIMSIIQEDIPNEHSKYATSYVKKVIDDAGIDANDIDDILVVNGPGSFTGIRVGVTVAKTIAWALKKDIIPLSSLELMATTLTNKKYIVPMIDARRGNIFSGIYDNELNCIKSDSLVNIKEFIKDLDNQYEFVSCDNLGIDNIIKPNIDVLKIIKKHLNDKSINPHNLNPNYLKLTEAEENKLKND